MRLPKTAAPMVFGSSAAPITAILLGLNKASKFLIDMVRSFHFLVLRFLFFSFGELIERPLHGIEERVPHTLQLFFHFNDIVRQQIWKDCPFPSVPVSRNKNAPERYSFCSDRVYNPFHLTNFIFHLNT